MYQLSQTLRTALAAGNPQRVLIEFIDYAPVVQFSNEDIAVDDGLHLTEMFNSEADLSIGQCLSAEISFTLLNQAYQLAGFEFGTFRAYLGARIDTGTPEQTAKTKTFTERGQTVLYEFAPLGTFTADRPDVGRNTEISVTANDQMTLFDKEMPSTLQTPPETPGGDPGTLTYPTTLGGLLEALCYYLGVPCGTTAFLNNDLVVSKKPKQFNGATMRDVLSWIAEAACSNARFNRDGELELFWLNTVSKTYDESNYSNYSQSWYETRTIDGLHIRNADSTTEFTVGTGDNAYLIQDNPFLRQSD